MHSKAMQATRPLGFHPVQIAKRMTLPVLGGSLVFDREGATHAFADFWSYEYRVNGKSLLEQIDPVAAGLDVAETEFLEAARRARTSFFQIEAVAPDQPQLRLRDLLAPDQPDVWVTDLGLSDSFRAGGWLALFCRLLTVRDITMTSGFSFGFATKLIPGLLQAYRQKTKRVPPDQLAEARFVFFYQKHRQCGIEQTYQKVV